MLMTDQPIDCISFAVPPAKRQVHPYQHYYEEQESQQEEEDIHTLTSFPEVIIGFTNIANIMYHINKSERTVKPGAERDDDYVDIYDD